MICGVLLIILGGAICFYDHNWLSAAGGFGVGTGCMLLIYNQIRYGQLGRKISIEEHIRELLVVAQKLCQIYFEIASEAIGEESVRSIRDEKIKGEG